MSHEHTTENDAALRAAVIETLNRHHAWWIELDGLHCACGWVAETTDETAHVEHVAERVLTRVLPPAADQGDTDA